MDRSILQRLASGQRIKAIARQLKIGRNRIRALQRRGIEAGYLDASGYAPGPTPLPEPPLGPFADPADGRELKSSGPDQLLLTHVDWVRDRLEGCWSPITVFEELPCPGVTRSSFYRFLARHELMALAQAAKRGEAGLRPPILHRPGEALLLDWGKLRDVLDPETGKRRTLWAFVGILGFSRYTAVRLVPLVTGVGG